MTFEWVMKAFFIFGMFNYLDDYSQNDYYIDNETKGGVAH